MFERGFVTYSEDAKCELLGVDRGLIDRHGAVSRDVAIAMARCAPGCASRHLKSLAMLKQAMDQ